MDAWADGMEPASPPDPREPDSETPARLTPEAIGAEAPPVEKKRRVIRQPQPKLDPERICGPRGIGVLPAVFRDFQPQGPGREFEDLNHVMKKLEHWAHRLYPKLPFDNVTERITVLGHKMAVKTYLQKLRMGLVSDPTQAAPIDPDPERVGSPVPSSPTAEGPTARYADAEDPTASNFDAIFPDCPDSDEERQLMDSARPWDRARSASPQLGGAARDATPSPQSSERV